jgi:hypothetical protein
MFETLVWSCFISGMFLFAGNLGKDKFTDYSPTDY